MRLDYTDSEDMRYILSTHSGRTYGMFRMLITNFLESKKVFTTILPPQNISAKQYIKAVRQAVYDHPNKKKVYTIARNDILYLINIELITNARMLSNTEEFSNEEI